MPRLCLFSRPAGCEVSRLILSFPRVNQTTLIPHPSSSQTKAATHGGCVAVSHGWRGSANSPYTSSLSVLNLSLSLSVSQRRVDELRAASFRPEERNRLVSLCSTHCDFYPPVPVCKSRLCWTGYSEAGSVQAADHSGRHIRTEEEHMLLQH